MLVMITAITALVTAVSGLIHSINTRKNQKP